MRKSLVCLVLLIAFASTASAGWVRAGLYGADVRALIIDPADPDTVYLGTSEGEVYVSHDGGSNWKSPRAAIPFPGYVVDNLSVDGLGRLWAASWGLWGGGVIAVSQDGGATWSRRDSGLEDFSVRALAVDPCDPQHVVAGGLTGVYRSRDGGMSWAKISDQENVESLAIDPRTSDRIYVGTWRQAWRTDDGGANWTHINDGMVLDTDVFSITIDKNNPDTLWASTCGWVYSSTDRGTTWTRFRDGFNNRRIHDIEMDPRSDKTLFAGSVAGLYRTDDRGKSWDLITDESLVVNAIGLTKERPNRVILGTEGDGVYVSKDGGKSFARSCNGLYNVRVASVASDPESSGRVYAAVLFGNAASGVYRSEDGGRTWDRMSHTKLPEVLSLLVQKDTPARFIAGTEKGFFWSENGEEWTQADPATTPLRVDKVIPYNSVRLFAATSDGVYTSRDSGKSWYRLGDQNVRTIDLAVGSLGGSRALYALTANGLLVFDGEKWSPIVDSPKKGRSLAITRESDVETIVVSGIQGSEVGHVDFEKRWHAVSVAEARRDEAIDALMVASASRNDNGDVAVWRNLALPFTSREVMTVADDPFEKGRFFVGTVGQGIFVFEPAVVKKASHERKHEASAEEPVRPSQDAARFIGGGSR